MKSQATKTTADILREARELIAEPDRWVKGTQAETAEGLSVDYNDPAACGRCAAAAIAAVSPTLEDRFTAFRALADALKFKEPRRIVAWNNAKRRRHSDVMAAFDRAIEGAS